MCVGELTLTAERIGAIPTDRLKKASMAAAVFGKCFYGQEAHYITQRHYDKLSSLMVTAMGEKYIRAAKDPFPVAHGRGQVRAEFKAGSVALSAIGRSMGKLTASHRGTGGSASTQTLGPDPYTSSPSWFSSWVSAP